MQGTAPPFSPAVPPPIKKQRASNTPRDQLTSDTEKAIERRRAELRRLQAMRASKVPGRTAATSADELLARARSQFGGPPTGGPPAAAPAGGPPTGGPPTGGPPTGRPPVGAPPPGSAPTPGGGPSPPAIPKPGEVYHRVRHSDIYPSAPKSEAKAPPQGPPANVPPETVARRLDGAFTDVKPAASASMAPPVGPPPSVAPPAAPQPLSAPQVTPRAPPAEDTPQLKEEQPSTARRDLLHNMRVGADTPPTAKGGPMSPELRMQKEIARMKKDKIEAMRKVARLEEEVSSLREASSNAESSQPAALAAVARLAEQQGDTAALEWVREQAKGVSFQPFVMTPGRGMAPLAMAASPARRSRVPTPHPKRGDKDSDEFLAQAVQCVPFEYVSEVATFLIRRPYGLANERDLWFAAGQRNTKMYENMADVMSAASLEVVATVKADNSLVVLYGPAFVQHRTKVDGDWNEFGNVNERDEPLGSISYIDSDANEKEYSLDEIFEGALAVREHYCSSILSTAAGLRVRQESGPPRVAEPQMMIPTTPNSVASKAFSETKDACEGTEDIPFEPKAARQQSADVSKPPPVEEAPADVLSVFIGMFFSTIFGFIWTIFVSLPIRILTSTFVLACATFLLAIGWLYLADDHGAYTMGAAMHTLYNRPGIA